MEKILEVIILCRSKEGGEATGNGKMTMLLCDLARLEDVKAAITEVHNQHKFLDALFINAGLGYAAERRETIDGMAPHFQVNYLSQFMLTLNLLDLLEASASGGRVIFNVTKRGEIDWDDIQMTKRWNYEKGVRQAMLREDYEGFGYIYYD